ncbi:hypothetical protein MMC07_000699 [Pseudocyphellaria aurata]|nr:hypothetical protein [Pseudocyphellaria aurata]
MASNLSSKSVLIAGAGMVSRPVGDILVRNGVKVIYGCRNIKTAQGLAKLVGEGASAISLDVRKKEQLNEAIKNVDLVVSLVPPPDHPFVIEAAISHKISALTTSYISPEMQSTNERCKTAGITVLNEIAPECSDNPLGYRFSWSPAGVLRALSRVAKYIENGKELHLSGVDLMSSAKRYETPYKGYAFESYANGDSIPYRERYPGLQKATTIVRGSLRYEGYAELCICLIQMGYLSTEERDFLRKPIPFVEATAKIVGATSATESGIVEALSEKTGFSNPEEKTRVLRGLRELGLFSQSPITPQAEASPFYTLCALLERVCALKKGDRDLVYLQHTFHVAKKDGSKSVLNATLIDYGDPREGGYSSMARLVGTPAAVGCLAILRGDITETGMLAPVNEKLAAPLRKILKEEYGISMVESETTL